MTAQLIPLADAVSALRSELSRAQSQAANDPIQFEVGPVEMTFQVVATSETTTGGKASVGFQLLGLGAELSAGDKTSDAVTHSVKITLNPRNGANPLQIRDIEADL